MWVIRPLVEPSLVEIGLEHWRHDAWDRICSMYNFNLESKINKISTNQIINKLTNQSTNRGDWSTRPKIRVFSKSINQSIKKERKLS